MNKKYLVVTYWIPDEVFPQTLSIILLDHDKSDRYNYDVTFFADPEFDTVFEAFGRITDCLPEVSYLIEELSPTLNNAQKKLIRFVFEQ